MCDCKIKSSRFAACLHKEKKVTKCWKSDWRRASCFASILTAPCRPQLIKRNKLGVCGKCAERFLPYNIQRPDRIKRFINYKESIGKGTTAIPAQQVPFEAVFDIVDMRKQPSRTEPVEASPYGFLDVREAGTDHVIDLADLVESPITQCEQGLSSLDTVSCLGGDSKDLNSTLENCHVHEALHEAIAMTIISRPNPRLISKGSVPKLATAPEAPSWRHRQGPPREYLVCTKPSQTSPADRGARARSLNRETVPVPPPLKLDPIFTGCGKHGFKPTVGCEVCHRHSFKERGVPSDLYLRECRSAPPVLISVSAPRPKYTCAPQAQCYCHLSGQKNCISCLERKAAEEVLNSAWI